jgi:hypothetical protein
VHPSQTKRKPVQVEKAHKKRNYVTEDPVITLTEDDVELVTNKVQYRGEEVVLITHSQREEIMAKHIEVHEYLQQL